MQPVVDMVSLLQAQCQPNASCTSCTIAVQSVLFPGVLWPRVLWQSLALSQERTVFYRERASGYYAAYPFAGTPLAALLP